MAATIRVRNPDGTVVEIPALKADPYVLTDNDKSSIIAGVFSALPPWEGGSY